MSSINVNGKNISEKEFNELTAGQQLQELKDDLWRFLFLLNRDPEKVLKYTAILNMPEGACLKKLIKFIVRGDHKIGEKEWCCGFLGSRWTDIKIGKNGEVFRLAFYSKKINPEWFETDNPCVSSDISKNKFLLMVMPN